MTITPADDEHLLKNSPTDFFYLCPGFSLANRPLDDVEDLFDLPENTRARDVIIPTSLSTRLLRRLLSLKAYQKRT
jgi:hypothetical protein